MSTTAKLIGAIVIVTVFGGVLRFADLGRPDRKYFDEVYYASDGCLYAGIDYRRCDLDTDSERSWVHPPLGKAFISWGIDPPGPLEGFGYTPLGWRVSAAAAGTATVALVMILAHLVLGGWIWPGVAGLLLATEHLHFVQSRIAMLDVFLAFFAVLGFLFLAADRRSAEDEGSSLRLGGLRPLRLLAGASFGAAIAVKWSGVFALAGGALLSVGWSIAAARRLRGRVGIDRRAAGRRFASDAAGQLLAFVVVPAVTYLVAWLPWLAERGFDLGGWLEHHANMAGYHANLDTVEPDGTPIHPYLSPAWSWFLLARPVAYYWQGKPMCCEEILGMGNPLLFWGALVVIPYLALAWASRKDWGAGSILVPILAQYVPWLFVSRPLFLFYMTPVTPFLALGAALVLRDVASGGRARSWVPALAAALVVAVSVGLFVFFEPVLAADHISYEAWQRRIWVYTDDTIFNWI